jgi:UDP-N-acetyl-D-glucosamine dehydrogenase
VAYKRDIDDVRESPALDIIKLLEEKGADVAYHDPFVAEVREDGVVRRGVDLDDEELAKADCVLIATDHSGVNYGRLIGLPIPIVDTRNAMREFQSENVIGLSGQSRGGALEARVRATAHA